jgi:hypothetical protein
MEIKKHLKDFSFWINLQHFVLLGLAGYLGATLLGPQLFPGVTWNQPLYMIIAIYSAFGGSLGDLISFGRAVKQKIQTKPAAKAKRQVRRKKEPNEETGS